MAENGIVIDEDESNVGLDHGKVSTGDSHLRLILILVTVYRCRIRKVGYGGEAENRQCITL